MESKKFRIILMTAAIMLPTPAALSAIITDPLEDIGPDGTAVTNRLIGIGDGNIAVTISNSGTAEMGARTYVDNSPAAFTGAGLFPRNRNTPLNPGNVSGKRFISTVVGAEGTLNSVQPIVFGFSTPVQGFGLTTLDLLENSESASAFVTLQALDSSGQIVATQTRTGPQGPSGLDLDWFVSSELPEITEVHLVSNMSSRFAGYGIDDLVLQPVPLPAAVWMFGSGLVMLLACVSHTRSRLRH